MKFENLCIVIKDDVPKEERSSAYIRDRYQYEEGTDEVTGNMIRRNIAGKHRVCYVRRHPNFSYELAFGSFLFCQHWNLNIYKAKINRLLRL